MGIMDDMKDKGKGMFDKAKVSAEAMKDNVPGGDKAEGLLDKAKGLSDKDANGQIDVLAKAKDAATGLVDKAKGLLHKD